MYKVSPHSTFDNRYQLAGMLGEGGMGAVYSAVELHTDRKLAIKTIHISHVSSADSLRRFKQEAEMLSKLSHKNIVKLYRYGIFEGVPYLAMELLDGATLRSVLDERTALPLNEALDLATQLADGLASAHANNIVHRDIKPNNIFITKDRVAKIIDFGLCKLLPEAPQEVQKLTQSGMLLGSVHYMSPEQSQGKPADKASDIYSLGIVIFEMLTGQTPFDYDNPIGILYKHVNDPVPKIAEKYPSTPAGADLDRILSKCLAKSSCDRFADMEELKKELLALQAKSSQLTTHIHHSPPNSVKRRKRNPLLITAAILSGIAIGGIIITPASCAKLVSISLSSIKPDSFHESCLSIAGFATSKGLNEHARSVLNEALIAASKSNDYVSLAEIYNALGSIDLATNKERVALDMAKQSLTALSSYKVGVPPVDPNRMLIAVSTACNLLKECDYRRIGNKDDFIDVITPKVLNSCIHVGAPKAALPLAIFGVESLANGTSPVRYIGSLSTLSTLYLDVGMPNEAVNAELKALATLPKLRKKEYFEERFNVLLIISKAYLAKKSYAQALAYATKAEQAVDGLNVDSYQLDMLSQYKRGTMSFGSAFGKQPHLQNERAGDIAEILKYKTQIYIGLGDYKKAEETLLSIRPVLHLSPANVDIAERWLQWIQTALNLCSVAPLEQSARVFLSIQPEIAKVDPQNLEAVNQNVWAVGLNIGDKAPPQTASQIWSFMDTLVPLMPNQSEAASLLRLRREKSGKALTAKRRNRSGNNAKLRLLGI